MGYLSELFRSLGRSPVPDRASPAAQAANQRPLAAAAARAAAAEGRAAGDAAGDSVRAAVRAAQQGAPRANPATAVSVEAGYNPVARNPNVRAPVAQARSKPVAEQVADDLEQTLLEAMDISADADGVLGVNEQVFEDLERRLQAIGSGPGVGQEAVQILARRYGVPKGASLREAATTISEGLAGQRMSLYPTEANVVPTDGSRRILDDPFPIRPTSLEGLPPADELFEPIEVTVTERIPRFERDPRGGVKVDGEGNPLARLSPDGAPTFETVQRRRLMPHRVSDGQLVNAGEFTVIGRRRNTSDGNQSPEEVVFVLDRQDGSGTYQVSRIAAEDSPSRAAGGQYDSQIVDRNQLGRLMVENEYGYISGPELGFEAVAPTVGEAESLGRMLAESMRPGAATPEQVAEVVRQIDGLGDSFDGALQDRAMQAAGFQQPGNEMDFGRQLLAKARMLAEVEPSAPAITRPEAPTAASAVSPGVVVEFGQPRGPVSVEQVSAPALRARDLLLAENTVSGPTGAVTDVVSGPAGEMFVPEFPTLNPADQFAGPAPPLYPPEGQFREGVLGGLQDRGIVAPGEVLPPGVRSESMIVGQMSPASVFDTAIPAQTATMPAESAVTMPDELDVLRGLTRSQFVSAPTADMDAILAEINSPTTRQGWAGPYEVRSRETPGVARSFGQQIMERVEELTEQWRRRMKQIQRGGDPETPRVVADASYEIEGNDAFSAAFEEARSGGAPMEEAIAAGDNARQKLRERGGLQYWDAPVAPEPWPSFIDRTLGPRGAMEALPGGEAPSQLRTLSRGQAQQDLPLPRSATGPGQQATETGVEPGRPRYTRPRVQGVDREAVESLAEQSVRNQSLHPVTPAEMVADGLEIEVSEDVAMSVEYEVRRRARASQIAAERGGQPEEWVEQLPAPLVNLRNRRGGLRFVDETGNDVVLEGKLRIKDEPEPGGTEPWIISWSPDGTPQVRRRIESASEPSAEWLERQAIREAALSGNTRRLLALIPPAPASGGAAEAVSRSTGSPRQAPEPEIASVNQPTARTDEEILDEFANPAGGLDEARISQDIDESVRDFLQNDPAGEWDRFNPEGYTYEGTPFVEDGPLSPGPGPTPRKSDGTPPRSLIKKAQRAGAVAGLGLAGIQGGRMALAPFLAPTDIGYGAPYPMAVEGDINTSGDPAGSRVRRARQQIVYGTSQNRLPY